jgi:hypothetical protein
VMRRRTIKENIGKELSIEMIELLQFCMVFSAIGNITFE